MHNIYIYIMQKLYFCRTGILAYYIKELAIQIITQKPYKVKPKFIEIHLSKILCQNMKLQKL